MKQPKVLLLSTPEKADNRMYDLYRHKLSAFEFKVTVRVSVAELTVSWFCSGIKPVNKTYSKRIILDYMLDELILATISSNEAIVEAKIKEGDYYVPL